VRWGRRAGEIEYIVMLGLAYLVLVVALVFGWAGWWILLPLATIPRALQLVNQIRTLPAGPGFNKLLANTAQLVLFYCVLFSLGIVLNKIL
jgi:1,4-dihydroxy-2-naphthoate octaprenyltransferase